MKSLELGESHGEKSASSQQLILLKDAKAKDPNALRRLLPLLERRAAFFVDPHTAEDVAQEAAMKVLGAAPRKTEEDFRRSDGDMAPLVNVIVDNTARDHLRSAKRPSRDTISHDDPDANIKLPSIEDIAGDVESKAALEAVIEELERSVTNRNYREAFLLVELYGLSYEEAARVMDVPIGTIRSRIYRAKRYAAKSDILKEWAGAA